MSNSTTTNRHSLRSLLRSRAAAVAAGVCATAVLTTAGVATAVDGASSDTLTSHTTMITARGIADATERQADLQLEAAKEAKAAEQEAKQAKEEAKREAAEARRQAERAKQAKARSWVPPISAEYALSATYGNSGDRWASSHSGQDFAVPSGTTVRAVHGGTVVKAGGYGAGDGSAYGNAIVVRHGDDTYSQYAHLSRVEVSVGEKVTTGERIARSGNTGNSSGPHLHFEVRTTPDYGTAVDPVRFLHRQDVTL